MLPAGAMHGQSQRSSSAVPTVFPSHAWARSKAGGCDWCPPSPLLHRDGAALGLRLLQGCKTLQGAPGPCFPQKMRPGGALQPWGGTASPTGLLQEPAGGDEPEQQFPEPVFALAAPTSMSCFPDAKLLGGIAGCLKPGLAVGLVSGWGHGSSQGLGLAHAPAPHSCPAAARLGFPTSSLAQALCLLSKPRLGWGGGQCHLLRNTPPLVFHPAKPGRIGSHPVSSHPTPPQPPISLSCSQPGEQPQFVLHQKQLWPGQLRLGWG